MREASEYAYELARWAARRYLPRFVVFSDVRVLVDAIDRDITVVDKLAEWIRKAKRRELDPRRMQVLQMVMGAIDALRLVNQTWPGVLREFFKADVVLEAVRASKPEIYNVLSSERGRRWLERSLRQLAKLVGVS